MRAFLLSLFAISVLLVPACNFRSSTSETEAVPIVPSDAPPVAATEEVAEQVAQPPASSPPVPEFALDPAPVPPSESPESPSSESAASTVKPSSAEDVFQSVARVLQGAAEGTNDETGTESNGSVFGSIGRALSKGFQEAVAGENAPAE